MKPTFSLTQPQIEKPGKWNLRIVPKSSDKKFHKILSQGCGEMASDGKKTLVKNNFLHETRLFP